MRQNPCTNLDRRIVDRGGSRNRAPRAVAGRIRQASGRTA